MEELFKKLDERLGRQEKLMEQLINMVGKNNEATFAMGDRLNKMDDGFDKIDSRLDYMDNRLDKIEEHQKGLGEGIQQIDGKVDRIEITLDERRYDIQALNKRVFKTESDMERLG